MTDWSAEIGDMKLEQMRKNIAALQGLTFKILDAYVSDATLDAMIAWLAAYRWYVRCSVAESNAADEPGYMFDTAEAELAWITETHATLVSYRRVNR